MVEHNGHAKIKKSINENPTCFRLNVDDFEESVTALQAQGISIKAQNFVWGSIARFYDPDGHAWQLRNSATFEKQKIA